MGFRQREKSVEILYDMPLLDEPAKMTLHLRRQIGNGAERMIFHKLDDCAKLGNRMLDIKRSGFRCGNELLSTRIVRTEEHKLAMVERATEREEQRSGEPAFLCDCVTHCEKVRKIRALQSLCKGHVGALRNALELRGDAATELSLGLIALKRRGGGDFRLFTFGGGLCGFRDFETVENLLRCSLAPCLDRLLIAHRDKTCTVIILVHAETLGQFAHLRIVAMEVGRSDKLSGNTALYHTSELTGRRLDIHLLSGIVVAKVGGHDMRIKSLLGEARESAGFAHMELDLRILGRDLHMACFGMIQEEPRDLLERIRRKAGLDLADYAAKLLLPGKYADLGLKRLDELALDESALFRLAAIERTSALPITVERLARS